MVRHAVIVALIAASSATVACGGNEEAPFSVASRHGKAAPAKATPADTGASPSDSTAPPEGITPPAGTGAPPAAGTFPDISFELSTQVDPASESQKCKFVQVPTDRGTIAVPAAESHFTPGSHHFLAYRT